ncbi:MAG: DUF1499 domain-containing protein [Methyloligellaceae bacterium]
MVFRNYRRLSAKAVWSRKVTTASFVLLLLTVILHRFASLHTPAALALMGVVIIGALFAVLLATWSLKQIWDKGIDGAGRAFVSIALATVILAGPAYYLPKYITLPAINDVTTDFNAPPNYEVLAQKRSIWANPVIYPGETFALKQQTAYPHIQPMVLERSVKEAYDLVKDAVTRLGWKVVANQAPERGGASGWIEATHKTLIMGYVDDVVVRVSGDDEGARIDVRSSSRFGKHDFGNNAQRIDSLFFEVRSGLAKGEQQLKLEKERQAQRALKLKKAEQLRREKAEQARLAKQEELRRQRAEAIQNSTDSRQERRERRAQDRRDRRRNRRLPDQQWNKIFNQDF